MSTMTKPDDIPQNVWDVAHGIAMDLPARIQTVHRAFAASVIARAILAERERCAKIARSFDDRTDILKISGYGVSAAIRSHS